MRCLPRLAAVTLFAATLLAAPAMAPRPVASIPIASASCPDVEVDFARGRGEAPGVGTVGQAFINSLQRKVPNKTVGVYGVNYPADVSVTKGSNDMSAHAQAMAASCPNTKLVLGGYSLGAAAAEVVISTNQPEYGFTDPLPPAIDQHVAAVALFGNAAQRVANFVPGPRPAYAGKVIDLCAPGDPVCSAGIQDLHVQSHMEPSYIDSGLVDQAATFVAGRL